MIKSHIKLHEVTRYLQINDWSNPKNIQSELPNPRSGLYLMIFKNQRDISINDRNIPKHLKGKATSGKIVVPSNSWSIKFGKFENFFYQRMRGYAKHMHFFNEHDKNLSPIFGEVLQFSVMLPLVDCTPDHINPAAMFENFWNSSIHYFLDENNCLLDDQNLQSEYRVVRPMRVDDYERISAFGQNIANKISQMAALI